MLRTVTLAATALAVGLSLQPVEAQTTMHATRVASGLVGPDFVTAPANDSSRLFIVEQGSGNSGRVRLLDLTQNPPLLQTTPYLTVTPILAMAEQGLLGLAFHPDFANNGYFFVYYTNSAGDNQVVRYRATAPYSSSTTADLASAAPVMTISHPGASNHNGGWIAFGPDGFLYISIGEADVGANAQNLGLRLGKLLRIDVDGDDYPANPASNYAIPTSNPFYGSTTALPEIWHYGLRNPWRASFDRLTGDLWIGDVGSGAFEEVNFIPAALGGLNFGWNCMEGPNCTGTASCACPSPALTPPVHAYTHTSGNCCIIGGYRYRGAALCNFQGLYFFGDYCSGRTWTAEWNGTAIQNVTEHTAELAAGGGPAIGMITSFGEDAAGEIYVCDGAGDVFRIVPGIIVDCNQNGTHDPCDIANVTSQDRNGNGLPDECEQAGTASCFGDGSTLTACPCANSGATGHGCDNSAATGGARLEAVGLAATDSILLVSSGELPSVSTIFLQGNVLVPAGIAFGDGLRCVAGSLKRLYVNSASGGVAMAPAAGSPSITTRSTTMGDPLAPLSGQVRYYQAYYRDPSASFCPLPAGNAWNISSMVAITW